MLMIIGRWDEYRKRMTGTQDIEKEWIGTSQTRRAWINQNVDRIEFCPRKSNRMRDHRIITQRMLRREATSAFVNWTRKISLTSRHGASSLR